MAKIMVNVQKRLNGASVRAEFLYGENIGGGRLRNRRQEWRVREEERMREEREMQWATRMRGRSLLQPGRILQN